MSQPPLFSTVHPEQLRLARVQLVNWGTFHGLTTLDVARQGHLITGESGSGKSSLLDAIATVLTPGKWLRYNTAAQDVGAKQGDRTLVSYVRGAWGKDEDAEEHRTVVRHLRAGPTWSGVALRFENERGGVVTALRLFHVKGASTDRSDVKDLALVVPAAVDLQDLEPYVSGGVDARGAKAAWPDALITTGGNHARYFARLRRHLGLEHETALQLLHRTQAAKNLGSLDRLFRDYMLDVPGTFGLAATAVEQFVDLKEAHRLVVRARHQLEALISLEEAATEFEAAEVEAGTARRLRGLLGTYEDGRKVDLLRREHERLSDALARAEADADEADTMFTAATDTLRRAEREVNQRGGDLDERTREELAAARAQRSTIEARWERLAGRLEAVGISLPQTAGDFAELVASARDVLARGEEEELFSTSAEADALSREREAQHELVAEVELLRGYRSNMDPALLRSRALIAEQLRIPAWELPFAGELLDVRPDFADWTGAIERVLRQLSTTLMVHGRHLDRVRSFVSSTHLGALLRFEEIPARMSSPRAVGADSLVSRIQIADTDPAFERWLAVRLSERFDYVCVESEASLGSVERGVTITGLVKRGARSYQKDDRSSIDDRRRWVLGSSNDAKLTELVEALRRRQERIDELTAQVNQQQRRSARAAQRRSLFAEVVQLPWSEIDVPGATALVHRLEEALARSSREDPTLARALREQEQAAAEEQQARKAQVDALAEVKQLRERATATLAELQSAREELAGSELQAADEREFDRRFSAHRRAVTLSSLSVVARSVGTTLADEERQASERSRHAEARFSSEAADFRTRFEETAAERTTSVDDREGYRELHRDIQERGLPAFEQRFHDLLESKSREIVGVLLEELRSAGRAVRERVEPVNDSLSRAPYDRGRYLRIKVSEAHSTEVREFIAALRRVVDNSWIDDAEEAESRYSILEPIMTRLGSNEAADQAWRARCLDTREHMTFLAHEVDVDGRVLNVHDSSSGLSGGQRQKLVVFCLAAALRYQLAPDPDEPPRYGTVILDEAFDKADANYTRSALDVFREFGFHLLLATPQKLLGAIEPYVGAVTVVSNPTHRQSLLAAVDWSGRHGAEEKVPDDGEKP